MSINRVIVIVLDSVGIGELHQVGEGLHEPGEIPGLQQVQAGQGERGHPIVLEVNQFDLAREFGEHVDRVSSAPLHPMHVDFEMDRRGNPSHDIEKRFAIVLGEIDMVIVVGQGDSFGGQPLRCLLGFLGEPDHRILGNHRLERHHPDPGEAAVQAPTVLDDLGEVGI